MFTAVPITSTKLFAWGEGGKQWRTCVTRDYETRPVWTCLPIAHKGVFGGEEERGGERSGPGEARARTILLGHIICAMPSKQPLMVRTFLKVYMELGSYFLFLQEQIKDIIIVTSHE